jgi:hypothetical protein
MDSEIRDTMSLHVISKELILTLLQCTGRLYKSEAYAKKAADLIKSKEF